MDSKTTKDFDHIIKKMVGHKDDQTPKGVKWDKERTWDRIVEALKSHKGNALVWYFSLAASISVMVASAYHLQEAFMIIPADQSTHEVAKNVELSNGSPIEQHVMASELEAKPYLASFDISKKSMTRNRIPNLPMAKLDKLVVVSTHNQNYQQDGIKHKKPFKASLQALPLKFQAEVGTGFIDKQFAPFGKINLVYLLNSEEKQHQIRVGTEVQFIQSLEEGEYSDYRANYFVTAAYGQQKLRPGAKSWEVGTGWLIPSDRNSFEKNTFKIFYKREIIKRVKFGPELIFTNNFRKLYPGITLSMG